MDKDKVYEIQQKTRYKTAHKYLSGMYEVFEKTMAPEMKYAQLASLDAMSFRIPKAPGLEGDGYDPDGNMIYDTWICPYCSKYYEVDGEKYNYCPKCGQAIQWEDVE